MKKILFGLFLVCAVYNYSCGINLQSAYAANVAATTMASAQSSTGVSANTCDVSAQGDFAIEVVLGGTSGSVSVDCQIADNTSWVTLSGSGLPVTTIATTLLRFTNHSICQTVRTNLTACTSCTLTVYCK